MPMPNQQITDGNYRYNFQGQEKDPETGMEAFELRLWDGRIGRWQTIDPAGEFHSPYLGMGNNPINAIDPDGGDIIYLNDSDAVFWLGHGAVLIGNDKEGWRYLSMNGTSGFSKPLGDSFSPDLGNVQAQWDAKNKKWIGNDFRKTGLTLEQVIKAVNDSNSDHHHNYDRAIRIKTNNIEDKIAYNAAKKQAKNSTYGIFGASCIDPFQEGFAAVLKRRLNIESGRDPYFWSNNLGPWDRHRFGFNEVFPNAYFKELLGTFPYQFSFLNVINKHLNNDFEYNEISASPRYN